MPGGGLTSAAGTLETPHGRIESRWTLDGDDFELDVLIPDGTSCLITLPDGVTHDVTAGHHHLTARRSTP